MNKDIQLKQPVGKVLPFHPTGDFYFIKGLEAYDNDDLVTAEKYVERATELTPDEPTYFFQLAIIYTDLGKFEQSNEILQKIIDEIDRDYYECYYLFANNFAYIGFLEEAYYYANYYKENVHDGQFQAEIEELLELLTFELELAFDGEDQLIMWQDRAQKLISEGQYGVAIEMLLELIEQYPNFWSAYNNLAIAYFYNGETDKCEATIEQVLQNNAGNLHALCNKLLFLYYEEKIVEVTELANVLTKVKPMISEQRLKLGTTFAIIGYYEAAFQLLKPLIGENIPVSKETLYYWLAITAYNTERLNYAKSMWKKVVLLNPDKAGLEPWSITNDELISNYNKKQ